MEVYTRTRGGEDRCPRCRRQRRGGLGPLPAHTCLTHRSAAQVASDQRAHTLARSDRAQGRAETRLRSRSIAAGFEVR
jgi:hypothetical protein